MDDHKEEVHSKYFAPTAAETLARIRSEYGTYQRPFLLSADGECLSETGHTVFANNAELINSKDARMATIVGHGGEKSVRKVVPIWVRRSSGIEKVFADVITGTLYLAETGECLTSDVRKVVKWSKCTQKTKRQAERNKERVGGRVKAQVEWNEGL